MLEKSANQGHTHQRGAQEGARLSLCIMSSTFRFPCCDASRCIFSFFASTIRMRSCLSSRPLPSELAARAPCWYAQKTRLQTAPATPRSLATSHITKSTQENTIRPSQTLQNCRSPVPTSRSRIEHHLTSAPKSFNVSINTAV